MRCCGHTQGPVCRYGCGLPARSSAKEHRKAALFAGTPRAVPCRPAEHFEAHVSPRPSRASGTEPHLTEEHVETVDLRIRT